MTSLEKKLKQTKIQSLTSNIGKEYVRPSPEKLEMLVQGLKDSPEALEYLKVKRNLTEDTIAHFKLGYSEKKNSIAIPEYKDGELINIKYRSIDPEAKTRYTQERGAEVWMFNEAGLDLAQEKGGILLVEGQFDAMSAWQAGFKNVISVSSGKESYGVWIELLDNIPKVWIAFDNDKPGKKSALDMAERIGVDKTYELEYPEEVKDANDYFKLYTRQDYKELIRNAKPFYKYKYQGLDSVIDLMRIKGDNRLELDCLPYVKLHEDWMIMVSGISGVGKTTYAMNIADELVGKGIPTMILPYERGIKDVGQRYLQLNLDKTEDQLHEFTDEDWDKTLDKVEDYPLYFSTPSKDEMYDVFAEAKKFFGVKVIIVDHLAYFLGGIDQKNEVAEIKNIMQGWKNFCIENNIIFVVVHHIRKGDNRQLGTRRPQMEDLVGGGSTFQVSEAVVMLSSQQKGEILVDIVKNKGEMGEQAYAINEATGRLGPKITTWNPEGDSLDDF